MDAFIVEAIRTPIGRGKADGALHGIHPVDLLAQTLNALVAKAGLDPAHAPALGPHPRTPVL